MSDDATLDAWFDSLAGRDTAGGATTSAAANEARALRDTLRARPAVDEVSLQRELAESDSSRAARLLATAQRDPVLGPILARGPSRRAYPRRVWSALLAAGIAGITVALVWSLRPTIETPAYREAPDQLYRVTADDPRALRDEIAQALRNAGVEVVTYERFGREGIDAELPRPATALVREILARYRIPEPADGVLRVEIEAASLP